MSEPYIISACRTPIGKFGGALSSQSVTELGASAVREAVQRAGCEKSGVQEVIMGNVLTAGVGQAPARQAALRAGLSESVPALTINKVCGSGLKAVMLASQTIRCKDADLVVAGGMESMSRAGWILPRESVGLGDRQLIDSLMFDGLTCASSGRSMGEIADRLASERSISRTEQDRYACQSHHRAAEAWEANRFDGETVKLEIQGRKNSSLVSRDEGPRPDSSIERLATLAPVFGKNGSATAGNASMISDGAAAVVLASGSLVEQSGMHPIAKILASVAVGTAPEDLFTAPVAAIRQVVAKAKLELKDIDLFEINEAFAVQVLACLQELKIDESRVNTNGGAIALGHPIGASGARVLVTLLHALQDNQRLGVAALCLGGGSAVAMVVERLI